MFLSSLLKSFMAVGEVVALLGEVFLLITIFLYAFNFQFNQEI